MKKDRVLLQTQPTQADNNTFLGTENPRWLRALWSLLTRSTHRKELDRIVGCANGPDVIFNLRQLGLEIPCERIVVYDRDGKPCRAGVYHFTDLDRRKINAWLKRRGEQS